MNRSEQMTRAADREEEYYAQQLAEGSITREQYNAYMREIAQDVRAAYEQDREDALRDVDADWGNW